MQSKIVVVGAGSLVRGTYLFRTGTAILPESPACHVSSFVLIAGARTPGNCEQVRPIVPHLIGEYLQTGS